MSYDIEAWLGDDGKPRLQILDADSGSLRLAWGAGENGGRDPALKALFRELLLLSALQRLEGAPDHAGRRCGRQKRNPGGRGKAAGVTFPVLGGTGLIPLRETSG